MFRIRVSHTGQVNPQILMPRNDLRTFRGIRTVHPRYPPDACVFCLKGSASALWGWADADHGEGEVLVLVLVVVAVVAVVFSVAVSVVEVVGVVAVLHGFV